LTAPDLIALLRCTHCGSLLSRDGGVYRCRACLASFPVNAAGQIDMRPQIALTRAVVFDVTPNDPLWSPGADEAEPSPPDVVSSLIPQASSSGVRALEVGCGDNSLRTEIEKAGWRYAGIDYGAASADCLADVHAMPWADGTFSLVVCKAMLEHVRYPHLAMSEIARVLTPGGLLVGDVAFLQPFHNSYYHMTHAAVRDLVTSSGLRLTSYHNGPESALRYLARNSYLPSRFAWLVEMIALPADLLYRLLTKLKKRVLHKKEDQSIFLAVGIVFSAVKPWVPPATP
jgi:SAM-dependent methyltransferase